MSADAPRPDDGIVIYRATRQQSLGDALEILTDAGIPAVASWRASHLYPYTEGRVEPGEGEVVIPACHAQRARELLTQWEGQVEARIREHLKDLPAQLRRVALIAGLCVFGFMTAGGSAWRAHPTAMVVFAIGLGLLLLWEGAVWLRARRERAERARFSVDQPPRWFER